MEIKRYGPKGELEIPLINDDYDVMEDLNYLRESFKVMIMNRSVIKYFGIDLLWHKRYR